MGNVLLWASVMGFALGCAFASFFSTAWLLIAEAFVSSVALLAASVLVKRPAALCAGALLLAFTLGVSRAELMPKALPNAFEPLLESRATLHGTVVRQPDVRETAVRLTVEVEEEGTRTRILAVAPPHGTYRIGDAVTVSGVLSLPEPFAADGGRTFAYDAFLAKDGVFAMVQPARVTVTGQAEGTAFRALRVLGSARTGFMRALERALPEPESALAAGLIVGGKQGLGKELLDAFTASGLLPIVVLSGYNVMVVAEGILRGLSFLPKRISLIAAAFSIALFVLAAGAGAASLRAGLMALLGLLARFSGRTYAAFRALGIAFVLMLLWNPLLLTHDPGFQFSLAATMGLIIGTPMIERRIVCLRSAFLRAMLASTIAAQAAVLPLLLYHTGNLSLVSIPANLLVLPAVPLAMALSGIAALIALVPATAFDPFAIAGGLPAFGVLAYIIAVARTAASAPLASFIVPAFSFWFVPAAYAFLLLIAFRLNEKGPQHVRAFADNGNTLIS